MATIAKRQNTVKSLRRSRAGDALTELIIPVIRLEAHFSRAGETIAAVGGQTLARWLSLDVIEAEPATVAQIARKLGLTRQSVQRVADLLDRDGLTEYVDNPLHQRSKLVRITPRGRRTLRTIKLAQHAWADEVGRDVGETDLHQLSRIVARLARALAAHPA